MTNSWVEDACRNLAVKDGRDPERWEDYITASQRSRIHAEIDARRDRGMFLCVVAMILLFTIPALVGMIK